MQPGSGHAKAGLQVEGISKQRPMPLFGILLGCDKFKFKCFVKAWVRLELQERPGQQS